MKRKNLYFIAVFLPLLVWSCKGEDLPDLIPPPPTPSGQEGGGGGGGDTPPAWEANRGKVVRPSAGNGWTVSTVREGITYYAYSGKDAVTGVNQEAFAIDLDLSNPNYTVALTHTIPAAVTSDVYKDNKAIVAMNAGYEAGSIFIKIGGSTKSAIPNTQISDTGVPNWKFYMQRQDKFIISSAPMLLDDYNPVGETYIDNSINNWSSLNSEHPQYHQRKRHPRTTVALTHDNHLILFVVDGRTTISNGMSAKELTQFLVKYFNPQYALNMDGGGSTAMCVEGQGNAETHLVNKPCDSGGRADKQRARDTHFVILEAQ